MKYTKTLIITLLWIAAVATTPGVLADQSDSFNIFGEIGNSPGTSGSDSYSAQDQTTWRTGPGQSDSFQTTTITDTSGGDSDETSNPSDSTSGSDDDSGGTGVSGGGRRVTVTIDENQPIQSPEAEWQHTERPRTPVRHPAAVTRETQEPREGAGRTAQEKAERTPSEPHDADTTPDNVHPATRVQSAIARIGRTITEPLRTAARAIEYAPAPATGTMTVAELAVLGRLVSIERTTAAYEVIPAFQSMETAAAPLLALRPGGIEICALLPFLQRRKKRKILA